MTLIDPTSGLGYAFGQKLPSTHMTTIATQQPNAIDGAGGGAYAPATPIVINGASALNLGGQLKYAPRTLGRVQPLVMAARTSLNNWRWSPAPVVGYDWLHDNSLGTACQHEFTRLAHNSVLDRILVRFKGAAHGAFWPPAQLSQYALYRVDLSGTATIIGTVITDASNQATFETSHQTIVANGTGHVIDLTLYRYILVVTAEAGANAIAGATYYGAVANLTISEQSEF